MGCSTRKRAGWIVGNVGFIPLTRGCVAKVSPWRVDELSKYLWCCFENTDGTRYAVRRVGTKIIRMHRQILGLTVSSIFADHINHDTLDNRDENLRACKPQQNSWNMKLSAINTTGFKGVSWDKERSKYVAFIKHCGKHIYLGRYNKLTDAADAYMKAAQKYFGEFANA